MNTMKNSMYLLFMISLFLVSCDEIDFIPEDSETIDCGGICNTTCITFDEGNYRGLWSSTATNGSVYTDIDVTAIIEKVSNGVYTGSLFISDNYTSCCNSTGINGDGPFTITIVNEKITFKWIDEIPGCTGEFNGTGIYSENNKIELTLIGNDCEGDHVGSIEFFE